MKVVILAGGLGTRLAEETAIRPKPMVDVGGKPILWHIIKIYATYGITDVIVCCGYKSNVIKEYFANYLLYTSSVKFDFRDNRIEYYHRHTEPWRVTLVDTGEETMTGGRLKRVREYLDGGTFCFTYGDGVANVDIGRLLEFHRREEALVTLTAVRPPGRFGAVNMMKDRPSRVDFFREKPDGDGGWINGGFFVVEPAAIDYIAGDQTAWEREPLEMLARDGQLAAFRHTGFWHPMDTLRDRHYLEELWKSGDAPWKVW